MTKRGKSYLENSAIALATLTTGIMAGFFYTYSININLAMLQVSGETYAVVQSLFNENVRHLLFFIFFFGGGATAVMAVVANWRQYRQVSFWLIVLAGLAYIFGVIVFTANVNLPLNYYTESWDPQNLPTDWSQTRLAWNRANALRVLTSGTAFILYLVVLVWRASNTSTSDPHA